MTRKELREIIKKIQTELIDEVPLLNRGGCVHFANIFSRELSKLHIFHKIVVCSHNKQDLLYSLKKEDSFSHVMIYINKIGYIDGHVTHQNLEYNASKAVITDKINLSNNIKNGAWNSDYKLSNNKKVEEIIMKYLYANSRT